MFYQYKKIELKEKAELDAYSERVKKIYAEASSDDDDAPIALLKKSGSKKEKIPKKADETEDSKSHPKSLDTKVSAKNEQKDVGQKKR